ncbi:MAG: hypothetical protein PGN16_08590 [Sphingomonas phyllosphaerae]|uniref:hypothetical protein n=1 Tax=Sphingomonas phyllosphaerae TaxID=257003 RepID=UPI002FF44C2F
MLSDQEIDAAKKRLPRSPDTLHEHNDCIRLAYQWLDAQKTVASAPKTYLPLKHMIEHWAGRYVSQSDVEVAALLHPRIEGKYPNYNLSRRLTRPSDRRLSGIGEALKHEQYRERLDEDGYKLTEE